MKPLNNCLFLFSAMMGLGGIATVSEALETPENSPPRSNRNHPKANRQNPEKQGKADAPVSAIPPDSPLGIQLATVQKNYESGKSRINETFDEENKKNLSLLSAALEPLVSSLTSSGNIEQAVKIKEAREAIDAGNAQNIESLSEELKLSALRTAVSQFNSIGEKIVKKRDSALTKLIKDTQPQFVQIANAAKKAGDLDGFLEIEKQREDLAAELPDSPGSSMSSQMSSTGGWTCRMLTGSCHKVADIANCKPYGWTNVIPPGIPSGKRPKDDFALVFNGFLHAPKSGNYTFVIKSDDGAVLNINGKEVVNNDGCHAATIKTGSIPLKAGWHPVELLYFELKNDEILEVSMGYESESPKPIPPNQMRGKR